MIRKRIDPKIKTVGITEIIIFSISLSVLFISKILTILKILITLNIERISGCLNMEIKNNEIMERTKMIKSKVNQNNSFKHSRRFSEIFFPLKIEKESALKDRIISFKLKLNFINLKMISIVKNVKIK